jgi:hypothetical protein
MREWDRIDGDKGRRGSESRRSWPCEPLAVTWCDWAVVLPAGRNGTLERGLGWKFELLSIGAERLALRYCALVVVGIGRVLPCIGAPDS